MKAISLHIENEIFVETEKLVVKTKKSRNRYINDALAFYNRYQSRNQLAKELEEDSYLARATSMENLSFMEELDDQYEKK